MKARGLEMASRVVLLLLLMPSALSQPSSCRDTEPCCFGDQPSGKPGDMNQAVKLATIDWLRDCLSAVRTLPGTAELTVESLLNGVLPLYSFTDLAMDSLDTDSSLADGVTQNITVHRVNVNLADDLAAVLARSRVNTSAEVLGYNVNYTFDSAAFHFGLAKAFNSLNDAHTVYETPFDGAAYHRLVAPWPALDADGRQIFRLMRTAWDGVGYSALHGVPAPNASEYEGLQIVEVNGQPVQEYIRQLVDDFGGYHSAGQRLNAMLASDLASGTTKLGGIGGRFGLPDVTAETFVFQNGQTATWQLTASMTFPNVQDGAEINAGREKLEAMANDASKYNIITSAANSVQELVEQAEALFPPRRRDLLVARDGSARAWSKIASARPHLEKIAAHLINNGETLTPRKQDAVHPSSGPVARSRFLQEEEVEEQLPSINISKDPPVDVVAAEVDTSGSPWVASYVMIGSDGVPTMVFKLNTYAPGLGTLETIKGIYNTFTQAASYATANGIDGLVLDLSANGGGYRTPVFYLLRLLNAGWSDSRQLCTDPQDFRHAPVWDYFVDNFSGGWAETVSADLAAIPDTLIINGTQPREFLFAYVALAEIHQVVVGFPIMNDALVTSYLEFTDNCTACGWSCAGCSPQALRQQAQALLEDLLKQSAATSTTLSDLGPMTELALTPKTFELHDPPASFYSPGRQYLRGGVKGNYSDKIVTLDCIGPTSDSRGLQDLLGVPSEEAATKHFHNFTRMVLLTDGTCGSACSLTARKLQLEGEVRTVSYGGFLGDPMDTSSFAGGSLENFDAFWRATWFTYIAGTAIFQPTEVIDPLLLPTPLPSSAYVTFNYREGYMSALGDNALPFQYYLQPADVHLPIWLQRPRVCPSPFGDANLELVSVWLQAAQELKNAPTVTQQGSLFPQGDGNAKPPRPGSSQDSGAGVGLAAVGPAIRQSITVVVCVLVANLWTCML